MAVDPYKELADESSILETLAEHLTLDKYNSFDYIHNLGGRFVLFVVSNEHSFVLQDATANQSFYYTVNPPSLFASTPQLLRRLVNAPVSDIANEIKSSTETYFPGVSTPYTNIRRLTANTLFDLDSCSVKRFFPTTSITISPITEQLVKQVSQTIKTQIELFNQKQNLALSLSTGIDSRVALAATLDIKDNVTYYSFGDPDDPELNYTKSLAEHLDINHTQYAYQHNTPSWFMSQYKQHTGGMSPAGDGDVVYTHLRRFPDRLELRSNVAEVARSFYRSEIFAAPNSVSKSMIQKTYSRAVSPKITNEF